MKRRSQVIPRSVAPRGLDAIIRKRRAVGKVPKKSRQRTG